MKKSILLFSLYSFLFSLSGAFAYTSSDVSNATYLADQGIITKQTNIDNYRLDDTITRAEAVGIALKIKGVILPENYFCKNYFTDVKYDKENNWKCRAIEIAADQGIISRSNAKFRPSDTITRAESLAMMMKAEEIPLEINEQENMEIQNFRFFFENDIHWQQEVITSAIFHKIIENVLFDTGKNLGSEGVTGNATPLQVKFYPNRSATRSEVFEFARNVINKKEMSKVQLYYVNENASVISKGSLCDGEIRIYSQHIYIPKTTSILRATLLAQLDQNNDPEGTEFGPWNTSRMYRLGLDKVNITDGTASIYLKHSEAYFSNTTTPQRLANMNQQSGGMIFTEKSMLCSIREQITALAKQFPTVTQVKLYINDVFVSNQ